MKKTLTVVALGLATALTLVSCGENNNNNDTTATNEETAHGDFAGKAWERTDAEGNREVIRFKKIAKAGGYALMNTTYCKDFGKAAVLSKVTAISSGFSSSEAQKQTVNGCVAELKEGTYSAKVQDDELTISKALSSDPSLVYTRAENYDLGFSCQFEALGDSGEACMEVYDLEQDKGACTAQKGKVSQVSCKERMNKKFEKSCALNTVKDGQLISQMIYFYDKDKSVTCPN